MSDLFPFIDMNITQGPVNNLELFKEVAWDFENNIPLIKNGDFIILEGNEALKTWIFKALHVNRYENIIYTWNYGNELQSLIGKGYSRELIYAEAKRYIEECLLINKYIKSIDYVEIDFKENLLSINFKVTTIYGSLEVRL